MLRSEIQAKARRRRARVIARRWLTDDTVTEIGQDMGISHQRVSQLYYEGLEQIGELTRDLVREINALEQPTDDGRET